MSGERERERETGVRGTHTREKESDVPLVLVLDLLLPEIEIPHQPAKPEQEQGDANEGAIKDPRNGHGDEGYREGQAEGRAAQNGSDLLCGCMCGRVSRSVFLLSLILTLSLIPLLSLTPPPSVSLYVCLRLCVCVGVCGCVGHRLFPLRSVCACLCVRVFV